MPNEIKEEFLEEYSIWNNFPELAESILFRDLFLNKKDDKSQKSIKLESLNESLEINEKSFSSNKSFSSKSSQLSRSISPITRKVLNNTENEEENFDFNVNEPKKTKNVKFELDNNDPSIQNKRLTVNISNTFETPKDRNVEKTDQKYIAIVAIDFGTTHSGYAYSFLSNPENIFLMKSCHRSESDLYNLNHTANNKMPTSLLLDPDGNFHSFGYQATTFYNDLDVEESKKWNLFEKFKMNLHNSNELNMNTKLKSLNGKEFSALKIFSYSLKWLKDTVLNEINDQLLEKIQNENIKWILTVPAIWKAKSKYFMREAAYEAEMISREHPDQLLIALEPEAASIYIRQLRKYQLIPDNDFLKRLHNSKLNIPLLKPDLTQLGTIMGSGTRYIVVDCGGGTIDITVHEIIEYEKVGYLKELYKASGGPFGSIIVDYEFENLLKNIFGSSFLDEFKQNYPGSYNCLMSSFESKKRSICPFKSNFLNINLPYSLIDLYKKRKNNRIQTAITKYNNNKDFVNDKDDFVYWSSQGMLRLSINVMKKLFQPAIENICAIIDRILNNPTVSNISYLFLVGGFAESSLLQQAIRNKYSDKIQIIIPHDVGLCIVKGAILFGLNPNIIRIRRSNLTYGVGVLSRFDKNKHSSDKKIIINGTEWCKNVFDKFLGIDECVSIDETIMRRYATINKFNQNQINIDFYSSSESDCEYTTDQGVKKCGTIILYLDKLDHFSKTNINHREIQIKMSFGETEIKINAVDVLTGKWVKSTIEFLER